MDKNCNSNYLVHYGVKRQKWGVRNYQNYDGSLTPLGREHYGVGQGRSRTSTKNGSSSERYGSLFKDDRGTYAISRKEKDAFVDALTAKPSFFRQLFKNDRKTASDVIRKLEGSVSDDLGQKFRDSAKKKADTVNKYVDTREDVFEDSGWLKSEKGKKEMLDYADRVVRDELMKEDPDYKKMPRKEFEQVVENRKAFIAMIPPLLEDTTDKAIRLYDKEHDNKLQKLHSDAQKAQKEYENTLNETVDTMVDTVFSDMPADSKYNTDEARKKVRSYIDVVVGLSAQSNRYG